MIVRMLHGSGEQAPKAVDRRKKGVVRLADRTDSLCEALRTLRADIAKAPKASRYGQAFLDAIQAWEETLPSPSDMPEEGSYEQHL